MSSNVTKEVAVTKTTFYSLILYDVNNFGQWQENGSLEIAQRANKIWKQALSEY